MSKSPEMEKFLENFVQREFWRSRQDTACVTCGSTNLEFRDALSEREFKISHMCQKCQDSVFGSPEDEESADSPCYDYWAEYNNRTDR